MNVVGYAWIQHHVGAPDFLGAQQARLAPVSRIERLPEGALLVPHKLAPEPDLLQHALFAIKHEGVRLNLLTAALRRIAPLQLVEAFRAAPNGVYVRKLCHLWEALHQQRLPQLGDPGVTARYVLANDEFSYELGTDEHVKHKRGVKRAIKADDIWRDLVAAYCIIETSTGGKVIEVIERGDIEYFRSLSPSGQSKSGLWGKFPVEAARKAVLKQCAKGVPHSSQLAIALGVDADERSYEVPDEMLSAALGGEVPADMMPPDFEPEYDQNTGEMRDAREPGAEG